MQVALVGLPNAGKSTLLNALTRAGAITAAYPFTTIEPNIGVAGVPDERLQRLAAIIRPDEVIPATIQFVDVAGLVEGAHLGEGLGNRFLSHIRPAEAIVIVTGGFHAPGVPHPAGTVDPQADLEIVMLELIQSDLDLVERRLNDLRSAARLDAETEAGPRALLERLRSDLAQGHTIRQLELDADEVRQVQAWDLLTIKPMLQVVNCDDDKERVQAESDDAALVLAARLEADLADMPAAEAAEYRAALGLPAQPALVQLVRACYRMLDLITYYTAVGGKILRAWSLRRGHTALQAAQQIHTDMARGFIRAEALSYSDLVESGSFHSAHEAGRVRTVGRDYQVHDGDILEIRFR